MAAKRTRTSTGGARRSGRNPQLSLSRSILQELPASRGLTSAPVDIARDILTFDPQNPGSQGMFVARALPRPITPVFKKGEKLAPVPEPAKGKKNPNAPMPKADVLIVTWTVAEGEALAAVLTPGHSYRDWHPYRKGWASYGRYLGRPARSAGHLASYAVTKIGGKTVVCVKSELHMSQDERMGTAQKPVPPILKLWQQMIADVRPQLVITTGTAGAIGPTERLGDTVVSQVVRFDCRKKYKALNRGKGLTPYFCGKPLPMGRIAALAQPRMKINADELPKGSEQPHVIDVPGSKPNAGKGIVTTDYFDFDFSAPKTGPKSDLTGLGSAVEMGDAVLGLLQRPPMWVAVRNASDPQMDGKLAPPQRARAAAGIYQKYGYWTTVCSAVVCWAIVAGSLGGSRAKSGGVRARGKGR